MLKRALNELPSWPRFLSREEAARYVGVSTDTFDDEVRNGIWPAGFQRGPRNGRSTWDRVALDRAADRASGLDGAARPAAVPTPTPAGTDLAWDLLGRFGDDIRRKKAARSAKP